MSDSGRSNDFYSNNLAQCARDWASTKNYDVPESLRARLREMAEALDKDRLMDERETRTDT